MAAGKRMRGRRHRGGEDKKEEEGRGGGVAPLGVRIVIGDRDNGEGSSSAICDDLNNATSAALRGTAALPRGTAASTRGTAALTAASTQEIAA